MTTKTNLVAIALATLLAAGCSGSKQKQQTTTTDTPSQQGGLTGTLQLSGAFALYPMAVKWAEEFKKLHPDVKIDISGGGAGKGMTDALAGVVDIGMVSREVYPEELSKGAYPIVVAKDAVVPTVNANNPEIASIRKVGLTREKAEKLWNKQLSTWGEVLGTSSKAPVHVFTRSDACGAAETFSAWFGKRQEDLKATAVFGDPGVASAVQKDRVGIGYNNIAYVYDQQTKKPFEGITVIPLDIDGNGSITPEEDFYSTSETLIQAIKAGKFPSPPARSLYMVTKGKPTNPALIEFLRFILTEGQKYTDATGYIDLSQEQLKEELNQLNS